MDRTRLSLPLPQSAGTDASLGPCSPTGLQGRGTTQKTHTSSSSFSPSSFLSASSPVSSSAPLFASSPVSSSASLFASSSVSSSASLFAAPSVSSGASSVSAPPSPKMQRFWKQVLDARGRFPNEVMVIFLTIACMTPEDLSLVAAFDYRSFCWAPNNLTFYVSDFRGLQEILDSLIGRSNVRVFHGPGPVCVTDMRSYLAARSSLQKLQARIKRNHTSPRIDQNRSKQQKRDK